MPGAGLASNSMKQPPEIERIRDAAGVLDGPFRGVEAIRLGLLTRAQLYGPRFRRVFPDVYVSAGQELDLATRSRAAYLLVADRGGVLAGYSAATLLGAGCSPARAPAEVLVGHDVRRHPGLLVRRGSATGEDVRDVAGCRVTSPLRTAWDLARRLPLVQAVAAVDALARCGGFAPTDLITRRAAGPRARGSRCLDRVVELADPRAESVMESQLRLLLVLAGLPAPEVQYPVVDPYGFVIARLDLAYPAAMLAITYDGGQHFTDRRSRADRRRDLDVADLGWLTLRFTYDDVDGNPPQTPHRVRTMLESRLPASSSTAVRF